MQTSPPLTVFVILAGGVAPAGLARAAVRNGWPIHQASPNHAQLEQALIRGQSSVVILYLADPDDLSLHLIRVLRSSRRCAVVIAVSGSATEDAEIQARAAGAGLFLPASADADLIERTVRALTIQPQHAARTTTVTPAPRARTSRSSAV